MAKFRQQLQVVKLIIGEHIRVEGGGCTDLDGDILKHSKIVFQIPHDQLQLFIGSVLFFQIGFVFHKEKQNNADQKAGNDG